MTMGAMATATFSALTFGQLSSPILLICFPEDIVCVDTFGNNIWF